jgi:hypothetical protein
MRLTVLLLTGSCIFLGGEPSRALDRAPLPPVRSFEGSSRRLVAPPTDPWITPAEANGFERTPSYEETIAWLERLAAATPQVQLVSLGRSGLGREIWMVVASAEGAADPEALRASGKPVVLAQAGIHAGEIDGKDAGLMLLRDLTVGSKLDLLQRVSLLFVPILNPDGHERVERLGRINQRGPRNAGWRTNATNLNLNRDYTKLDAPETRAVVSALVRWRPDLYLDLHVTDGCDHQYDITFGGAGRSGWSPAIGAWMEDVLRPAVDRDLSAGGHVPGPLWVASLVDNRDPTRGLTEWPESARLSHGYGDARHLPTLLVEDHSLKPYDQRVLGVRVLLESVLRLLGAEPAPLRAAIAADRSRREAEVPLTWTTRREPVEVDYLGIGFTRRPSAVSGGTVVSFSGEPQAMRLPLFLADAVASRARLPRAWWVPTPWTDVIERLARHGLVYERLAEARDVEVVGCRLVEPKLAAVAFEGRVRLELGGGPSAGEPWQQRGGEPPRAACVAEPRTQHLPAGSLRIPSDQPLGTLAAVLLEPESPDSFLQWGFFDEVLQRTEYVEPYVMEPLAERLLAEDEKLRSDYEAALEADPELAKDPDRRLRWLYRRTPYADGRYLLYPVFREELGD